MRKSAVGDNRTESITLRVGKNVLDKLREEADRTMKTVNILGNQYSLEFMNTKTRRS
jgi:hypothetical protein